MKLAETKFRVLFNNAFVKLLDLEAEQIAWMVREAAKMMTTDKWDSNTTAHLMGEDMDCWQHDMVMRSGQVIVLEAVPYPIGSLILWTPDYSDETMPQPGSPETTYMNYPDDFLDHLGKDRKELGVFKVEDGVGYK
jgi:ribosomal protein S11